MSQKKATVAKRAAGQPKTRSRRRVVLVAAEGHADRRYKGSAYKAAGRLELTLRTNTFGYFYMARAAHEVAKHGDGTTAG